MLTQELPLFKVLDNIRNVKVKQKEYNDSTDKLYQCFDKFKIPVLCTVIIFCLCIFRFNFEKLIIILLKW